MSLRSTRDTLEAFRILFRTLELNRDPAWDTREFSELERILRKRIADLEGINAAESRL